jgi:hypothetical protein
MNIDALIKDLIGQMTNAVNNPNTTDKQRQKGLKVISSIEKALKTKK